MTMWLTYPVMVKVKPVESKAGWFEMHGLPYRPDYLEVREFAADHEDALIRDAKVVGFHDDEPLVADDPRFNHEEVLAWREFDTDEGVGAMNFAVAMTGDGPVMMFTCNRPEGVLFERLFDHLEGPQ